MSIKDATPEEISTLRARLEERQAQRRFDADSAQVIGMVHRRPVKIVEERATPLEKREYVARTIPTARAFSVSACAVIIGHAFTDNWLFLLAMAMSIFAAVAVM